MGLLNRLFFRTTLRAIVKYFIEWIRRNWFVIYCIFIIIYALIFHRVNILLKIKICLRVMLTNVYGFIMQRLSNSYEIWDVRINVHIFLFKLIICITYCQTCFHFLHTDTKKNRFQWNELVLIESNIKTDHKKWYRGKSHSNQRNYSKTPHFPTDWTLLARMASISFNRTFDCAKIAMSVVPISLEANGPWYDWYTAGQIVFFSVAFYWLATLSINVRCMEGSSTNSRLVSCRWSLFFNRFLAFQIWLVRVWWNSKCNGNVCKIWNFCCIWMYFVKGYVCFWNVCKMTYG